MSLERSRSVRRLAGWAPLVITALGLAACGDPWGGVTPVDVEPVQVDYETFPSWHHRGVLLEAVADYEIEAIVLSVKPYRFARMGRAVPLDVALAWGPMADANVLRQLKIAQRYRWYIYSWQGEPPLPEETMQRHSANVHIVPATREIQRQAMRLGPGDRVRLHGRLVNVSDERGEMRTSRSRTDRAGGSCEIMWVDELMRL